jgi:hypothetical protein
MKLDDYLKMLDDRIADCKSNMDMAYRNYLAEKSKLKAAMTTREMYLHMVGEKNDRSAL